MAAEARMQPLTGSLTLMADEVDDLVGLGETVQTVISRLVLAAGGMPDMGLMVEAQSADMLSQRLAGLAAFMRALAAEAPADLSANITPAVRALTLSEQARRLAGPAHPPTPAPESGDLTTFWD